MAKIKSPCKTKSVMMCALAFSMASIAIEPQVDADGNLTFTVAEGASETYSGVIAGDGITVFKKGAGALTLTGANTFTGTLRVEEGTLTASATAHAGKPALVVCNGASFVSAGGGAAWSALPLKSIEIEGSGVGGQGAFVRQSGTEIRNATQPTMTLTGDATINFAISHNPGAVSLNGYTLTKIGKGNWDAYNTGVVSENLNREGSYGKIVISAGRLQIQQTGFTRGSDANELIFSGGSFAMYPISWGKKCPWSVKINKDTVFSSKSDDTANNKIVCLSGPVEISSGKLTLEHAKDSAVFNFDGKVTVAEGCGIVAKKGITRFHGDVDIGNGTYEVVKSGSATDTTVEFLGNFNGMATEKKSFLPRKGLTRFSGAKSVSIASPVGDENDKHSLDGGTTGRVEVVDVERFYHPGHTYLSGTQAIPQTLYITNSVWDGASGVIDVGNNFSYGCLEMIDSIVTNSIRVGGMTSDGYAGSNGAIYQEGGAFHVPASVTIGAAFGRTFGYYGNDGGEFSCDGEMRIGGKGYGSVFFFGGLGRFAKVILGLNYDVAKESSGAGVYYQTGGSTNSIYHLVLCGETATNAYALVALEGTETCLKLGDGGCNQGTIAPSVSVLAVNDGAAFRTTPLKRLRGTSKDAIWCISVDGGVLEPGWTGERWGKPDENNLPDAVIVHSKGMTLNTDWGDTVGDFVWKMPLTSPEGKIVSSIALPTDETFGTSHQGLYIAPPLVRIHGAGKGAAAIALFDKKTRRVTGIKVVAPGTGYDENTTAEISGANGTRGMFKCPVTLMDAPTTGAGFTKDGPGNYVFNVANTYHGPTKVKGGKLLVRHAQGIPEGSSLSVAAGATADLSNYHLSVPELSGAGTVNVGGSLTVTEKLVLPTSKDECLSVGGALVLADGAEIVFDGDLEDLVAESPNRLVSVTTLSCAGEVKCPELPYPWKLTVNAHGVSIKRAKGTVFVLR